MIKSYTVVTREVDDAEAAGEEIARQLANITLLKNTVGLVHTHPEIVTSGVFSHVFKLITFPTIGMTTVAHILNDSVDSFMISILILTSDDCEFTCEVSDTIGDFDDAEKVAAVCYERCAAMSAIEPKFALIAAPLFDKALAGKYIAGVASVNKTLPMFGAVANDIIPAYDPEHSARTLCNGNIYKDRFALLLVRGNITPKFYLRSAAKNSITMPDIGVVTESEKNKIIKINGINAVKFLKDIGFLTDDPLANQNGMLSSVFLLRLPNGGLLSRIPVWIDGDSVVCGGDITTGSTLSIAFNTKEAVLETAKELTDEIIKDHSGTTILMSSCLGRRFCLANDPFVELRQLSGSLSDKFITAALYTYGEVCPVKLDDGSYYNLDHNQTLAACVI